MVSSDQLLDIATGKSRHETAWKNKRTTWPKLSKQLSTTHRTHETVAEYESMTKDRQAEVKDVGGFVGGYLSGGKRSPGSVVHRQILTLDLDDAGADLWQVLTGVLQDTAALVYSTHKHTTAHPRLRLVMPLLRAVVADEYEAVGRFVAGKVGIERFDHTGFQVSRLMYWPSTSKDGEYVFEEQQGAWLDPDQVLATYVDWKDSSSWPVAEKFTATVKRGISKQADPLDKPGIVGAFCRTYTITEAIQNFLNETYTPTAFPDRYSYSEGSTAGGLIIYDDKFAYSHHGTDPCSGQLCNAFDLVRLHKYGDTDQSFKDMADYAASLPDVRKQIFTDGIENAKVDFGAEIRGPLRNDQTDTEIISTNDENATLLSVSSTGGFTPAIQVTDLEWVKQLDVDRKGVPSNTINNFVVVMENDPLFKDKLAFDEFAGKEILTGQGLWRIIHSNDNELTDRDEDIMQHRIETLYSGLCSTPKFRMALAVVLQKHRFHPVKDYLNVIRWDTVERVDSLLIDYMGSEDTLYTRTVTRKTLVGAVARIMRPGCKFDTILTLVGEQGRHKSTLFRKLAGAWFSDSFSLNMLNSKEGFEQLRGRWIIEIAELSGLAKGDVEHIKAFVASSTDHYRPAYGRKTVTIPRSSIFVASTNKWKFLKDKTGNRRFWPVGIDVNHRAKSVDMLTPYEVSQIWAEAMEYYLCGEELYLTGEAEQAATQTQKEHEETHPWTTAVHEYLKVGLPVSWPKYSKEDRKYFLSGENPKNEEGVWVRDRVCLYELWEEALGMHTLISERDAEALKGIMQQHPEYRQEGRQIRFGAYGRQRQGWVLKSTPRQTIQEDDE